MILNFLRVAECPLAFMVSSSYSEYHSQKANARDIIAASKLRSTIETVRQSTQTGHSSQLQSYFARCQQCWSEISRVQQIIVDHDRHSHRLLDDLLQCGRVIRIRDTYQMDAPALVLDGSFTSAGKHVNPQRTISILTVHRAKVRSLTDLDRLILKENEPMFVLPVEKWKVDEREQEEALVYQIKNIALSDVLDITDQILANVNYHEILEGHWNQRMTDDVEIELQSTRGNDKALRKAIEQLKSVRQALSNQSGKFPLDSIGAPSPLYLSVAAKRFHLLSPLLSKQPSSSSSLDQLHQLNESLENELHPNVDEHFHQLRKLNFYENKYAEMNQRIASVQSNLQTSADYESMLEILKKLNYISRKQNLLRLKGQVAAIFGSGKELLLTELIYQNLIDGLSAGEIAALLSAIIFQGKRFDENSNTEKNKSEITPALTQAKAQLSRKFSIVSEQLYTSDCF